MNNPSSRRPPTPSRRARAVRASFLAVAGSAALLSLSGCYYYPAGYGYGSSPYYATAPAPAVAVAPAYPAYYPAYPAYPAYSYPSLSIGVGGYWGGRHWRR